MKSLYLIGVLIFLSFSLQAQKNGSYPGIASYAQTSSLAANAMPASMPFVTVITPTSYSITNGTTLTFPDTTTMWLNIATNSIWFQYTNSPWYYPIGGTIYVKDGDNILTTNIDFYHGNASAFTNWIWSWDIEGQGPDSSTFLVTCTNSQKEGYFFFGHNTNTLIATGGYAIANGSFIIRKMGLYAANQANNEVIEVVGADYVQMENCKGGMLSSVTNISGAGYGRILLGANVSGTTGNNFAVARFICPGDDNFDLGHCSFQGADYGVIEDCDTVRNHNIAGSGLYHGMIHSRVVGDEEDSQMRGSATCVVYDTPILPTGGQGFVGTFGPDNMAYGATALVINSVTANTSVQGTTWNITGNPTTAFGYAGYGYPGIFAYLCQNSGGARVNFEGMYTNGFVYGQCEQVGGQGTLEDTFFGTTSNTLDDGNGNAIISSNITANSGVVSGNGWFIVRSNTYPLGTVEANMRNGDGALVWSNGPSWTGAWVGVLKTNGVFLTNYIGGSSANILP